MLLSGFNIGDDFVHRFIILILVRFDVDWSERFSSILSDVLFGSASLVRGFVPGVATLGVLDRDDMVAIFKFFFFEVVLFKVVHFAGVWIGVTWLSSVSWGFILAVVG